VAVFATGSSRSAPPRGAETGARFFFYAVLSLVLMFLDQRGGWLERVRYVLQAAAYPIQLAVNSPSAALRWTRESFEARATLQAENAQLQRQVRQLQVEAMRNAALEQENAQLRGLRARLPGLADRWLLGEVISTESTTLRQRLVINLGAARGVAKAQTVIANGGLLGQTLRVGPWSTEVILITDPEHAVPVQVVRNGLRTLAVGSGETRSLTLPYLPIQSDIREGDELVSSGLGGVFPAGYPVGRIVEVRRDGSSPLAQVRAVTTAAPDRDREVMVIWFRPGHPAAPMAAPVIPPVEVGPTASPATTKAAPPAAPKSPARAPAPVPASASKPAPSPAPAPAPAPATVPGAAPVARPAR
jgi:rod shape-determining protein MreC